MAKSTAVRFPRLQSALQWLADRWRYLRQLGLALRPMRFSLIMVAAGAVFLLVDQGLDTLRHFAEYQAASRAATVQTVAFLSGAFLWVFGAWYWARVMSYIAFRPTPEPVPGVRLIQTWGPRVAGLVAIASLAVAFHRAGLSYDRPDNGAALILRNYMYATIAGGALYLVFVITRRRLVAPWLGERMRRHRRTAAMGRSLARVRAADQEKFNRVRISRLPRATWGWLAAPGVVAVVFFVLFAFWPAATAPVFGAAAILLLAVSGWIAFGSAADMFGMHHRFPVFTVLFLLAVLFSFSNDNHAIRTLDQPPTQPWAARASVETALREWMKQQLAVPTARADTPLPLFVVAAEGGGIRAAYWTANVLTAIQDRNPCFADQLFALSGVSGGSLGSAVFTAQLADQRATPATGRCTTQTSQLRDQAKAILGEDFLAPAVAATLYPDLVQRIVPFAIPRFDRARALETAWERAWRRRAGNDRFAEPFDNLWEHSEARWLPRLLLNGTWVETGKRLITSDLRVQPRNGTDPVEFADVEDTHRFYDTRALPLSAAVHLSARFTYVSPAGSIERGGKVYGRVVDGGYFENSGTTTALEVIKTIDLMADRDAQWKRVRPYVILISNDPLDLTQPAVRLDNARHRAHIKPSPGGNEVLSPWLTLLNTREARGSYATVTTRWHLGPEQFLHFGLCKDRNIRIPLGWVLSQAARTAMDSQLASNMCSPQFANQHNLDTIDAALRQRFAPR
jgi:hypothetical protein